VKNLRFTKFAPKNHCDHKKLVDNDLGKGQKKDLMKGSFRRSLSR